jgi:hypothetical protein
MGKKLVGPGHRAVFISSMIVGTGLCPGISGLVSSGHRRARGSAPHRRDLRNIQISSVQEAEKEPPGQHMEPEDRAHGQC